VIIQAKYQMSKPICAICIDDIDIESGETTTLQCNHQFHKKCIEEYFTVEIIKKNNKSVFCPLCRSEITNLHTFDIQTVEYDHAYELYKRKWKLCLYSCICIFLFVALVIGGTNIVYFVANKNKH
jgi:hypothetical protein